MRKKNRKLSFWSRGRRKRHRYASGRIKYSKNGGGRKEYNTHLVVAASDLAEQLALVVFDERRIPTEKNVQNDPNGPHVGLGVVRGTLQDFGSNVAGSTALRRQTLGTQNLFGKTKVGNLDGRVGIIRHQQQILRLEVTVGNVVSVTIADGLEDDAAGITGLLLVVVGLGDDAIEQLTAGHLLHDEVVVARLLEEVVQTDDVRVSELLEDGHLVEEGGGILLGQLGPVDALDGEHSVAVAAMVALPDGREGTGAELHNFGQYVK